MTTEDQKLFESWRIKARDASGKRTRPCDGTGPVSDADAEVMPLVLPAQRGTGTHLHAARLKAAEQRESA